MGMGGISLEAGPGCEKIKGDGGRSLVNTYMMGRTFEEDGELAARRQGRDPGGWCLTEAVVQRGDPWRSFVNRLECCPGVHTGCLLKTLRLAPCGLRGPNKKVSQW